MEQVNYYLKVAMETTLYNDEAMEATKETKRRGIDIGYMVPTTCLSWHFL